MLVESDWYDGPRGGLADVDGVAHYFRAVHYYWHPDAPDDEYFVWPASDEAVAWEREQWLIFVEWNVRYEAGEATMDTHPGTGGVSARYDELEQHLAGHRATPGNPRRLIAQWHWPDRATRYAADGPDYVVRWHPGRTRQPNWPGDGAVDT